MISGAARMSVQLVYAAVKEAEIFWGGKGVHPETHSLRCTGRDRLALGSAHPVPPRRIRHSADLGTRESLPLLRALIL